MAGVWKRVRSIASTWLTVGGVASIGYGVAYWLKGFPYPTMILMVYGALGGLLLGSGLSLRIPASSTTLWLSGSSFALSAALLLLLFWMPPLQPGAVFLFIIAGTGAILSFLRLRRLGKNSG